MMPCGHQTSVHEGLSGHFKTSVSRSEVPPALPRVAQRYARNANQLFQWRKKYREGRLGSRTATATKLLPVTITDDRQVEAGKVAEPASPSPLGTIEILLPKGKVHITGRVDLMTLRTAMECLLR